ncbi:MAG TPA: phosphatase PAP2 family protein [Lichenihabitans sp.]|jgi:undecaprenyl-diphosphatase|nr:phosphatase PAP2 family protein [Lichenihabitans sp.]
MTRDGAVRLAGFSVGLMSLGMLVWLIVDVVSGSTQGFDLSIRDSIHRYASPALTAAAQAITILGSILFLSVASLASIIGLLLARLRREAGRLGCLMAGALGIENGLKYSIHRVRPEAFFGVDPTTYSFPSGHSLLSLCFYVSVAVLIARRLRGGLGRFAVWTAAALAIVAIGLSRIYLGVHYPTDVIGGYLTAALWTGLVFSVLPTGRTRARGSDAGA